MQNLILMITMGFMLVSTIMADAQSSNLYKMRNGAVVTTMGLELIQITSRFCTEFSKLQGHFNAMTNQRDDTTDFSTPSVQWGTLDPTSNAVSEPVAEAMYGELNSLIGNTQAAVSQWCARILQ